jgi:hypothetical protein
MLNTAQEVTALASELGTAAGLSRVKLQIDLLNTCLAATDVPFSNQELVRMSAALASLGDAVTRMNQIARSMLAEAGVCADHVG